MAKRGGVETDVRCREKERCRVLRAMKGVMRCRTLDMEAKRRLHEGIGASTALHGAATYVVRNDQRRMSNVFEMLCFGAMAGVMRMDLISKETARIRTEIVRELKCGVYL